MSWLSDFLRRRRIAPEHHTRRALARYVDKRGFLIGDYTYGAPRIMPWGNSRLTIGHYCSIGPDVRIFLGGNHQTQSVSTYPFDGNSFSRGDVIIGSDVWIGAGATVLSGVTIGDGAVIGACALVSKNVDPFSIVAGNPARHVRYRFGAAVIEELLAVKWWDLPRAEIEQLAPLLILPDLASALAEIRRRRELSADHSDGCGGSVRVRHTAE